jgi:hypothetical protein
MAYLSTPCTDASAGKQCIKKAIDALFSSQGSDGSKSHLESTSESTDDVKPTLIWSCVYVQEITQVNFFFVIITDCIHVHFSTGKQICSMYMF